ncbi:unnamed protein product [Calypogeia fissa]
MWPQTWASSTTARQRQLQDPSPPSQLSIKCAPGSHEPYAYENGASQVCTASQLQLAHQDLKGNIPDVKSSKDVNALGEREGLLCLATNETLPATFEAQITGAIPAFTGSRRVRIRVVTKF